MTSLTMKHVIILIGLVLASACAHCNALPATPDAELVIATNVESNIFLLSSQDGVTPIGVTGSNARFYIQKERLRADHVLALLLCAEGYYCSAVLVNQDLLAFKETVVHLARKPELTPHESDHTGSESRFCIWHGDGTRRFGIPGAKAHVLFASGGWVDLAETDQSGCITLPRDRLEEQRPVALVVCEPHFFCGAVLFAEATLHNEYSVRLAPVAVH